MSCLKTTIVLLLTSVLCICHGSDFSYHDCMPNGRSNSDNVVHVNSATVTPVVVPGPVTVDVNVEALQNVTGNLRLDLSIKRKVIGLWVPVPCLSNVGSCTYDACDLLNSGFLKNNVVSCPTQLAEQHLPCTCPFQKGVYSLHHATFQIPELTGIWSWLASGDYKVEATLTDKTSNVQKGCYEVEVSIGAPCSFFSCLFG